MIKATQSLIYKFECFLSPKITPVADLFLRLVIAQAFWKSGMSKLKDLGGAADLFQYEWFSDENWWMALFGLEEIPRALAMALGILAGVGEVILPVLLIIGLFTRFAATGLMVIALVIVLLVYPIWTEDGLALWWSEHIWWIAGLLALMAFGGQRFSLDFWMKSKK